MTGDYTRDAVFLSVPTGCRAAPFRDAFSDARQQPVVSVVVSNPWWTTAAGFGVVCRYVGRRRFHALAVGTDGTYAILRRRGERLTVLKGGGRPTRAGAW